MALQICVRFKLAGAYSRFGASRWLPMVIGLAGIQWPQQSPAMCDNAGPILYMAVLEAAPASRFPASNGMGDLPDECALMDRF